VKDLGADRVEKDTRVVFEKREGVLFMIVPQSGTPFFDFERRQETHLHELSPRAN